MPQSRIDFTLPPVRELCYFFFGHVSFAVSDGRSLVLIDPFFSGRFTWKDKSERHLDPPEVRPDQLKPDAVLISHEHGDHLDPDTLRTVLGQCAAPVYAPQDSIDLALAAGLDADRFRRVSKLMRIDVGQLRITAYPAIESDGKPEPVQRVGYLVEHNGSCFYHQGDSHGPAPSWQAFKDRLDAMVIWPVYVDNYVFQMQPRSIIIHHLDRFEPGDFFCNKDPKREREYWNYRYPQVNFVTPPRNVWLRVKNHQPVARL